MNRLAGILFFPDFNDPDGGWCGGGPDHRHGHAQTHPCGRSHWICCIDSSDLDRFKKDRRPLGAPVPAWDTA